MVAGGGASVIYAYVIYITLHVILMNRYVSILDLKID